nr:hypothetical protein GCM10020092_056030 [Actinoplanes digitatis]
MISCRAAARSRPQRGCLPACLVGLPTGGRRRGTGGVTVRLGLHPQRGRGAGRRLCLVTPGDGAAGVDSGRLGHPAGVVGGPHGVVTLGAGDHRLLHGRPGGLRGPVRVAAGVVALGVRGGDLPGGLRPHLGHLPLHPGR